MEYFPGFNTLQLSDEVKSLLLKFGKMFNDIPCGSRDNEKECMSNANLVTLFAKKFGKGQWSFFCPGSE